MIGDKIIEGMIVVNIHKACLPWPTNICKTISYNDKTDEWLVETFNDTPESEKNLKEYLRGRFKTSELLAVFETPEKDRRLSCKEIVDKYYIFIMNELVEILQLK